VKRSVIFPTLRACTDCSNPQKHLRPGIVCPLPPVTPSALGWSTLGRRLFRAFRWGCRDGRNHSSSCVIAGVWRHTASFAMRSFLHRANGVWTARKRRREPLIGIGPGCWAAYLLWIWLRVPFATVTHCRSLLPSPMSRLLHASSVISSWRPSHLLLHLPVVAKRYSLSPKPTPRGVGSSATCAPRRCISPLCACEISFEIPLVCNPALPVFPNRPSRGPRAREPLKRSPLLS
jgi:hypothetical protein